MTFKILKSKIRIAIIKPVIEKNKYADREASKSPCKLAFAVLLGFNTAAAEIQAAN